MDTNKKMHSTTPYIQLVEKIEELQQEAKRIREVEIHSVIDSIQKQISCYGITMQELGYNNTIDERYSKKKSSKGAYYKNKDGKIWYGLGRQPRWFKEALLNGMKKEDFCVNESDDCSVSELSEMGSASNQ